ncbi:hypothetical protein EDB87DRAFT_1693239 [Lactarius vividus]|nr:hypothetical protein EDB87DRAFT_1693239 [Lactarius vividus]
MDPFGYGACHPPQHYLVQHWELSLTATDFIKRQVEAWSWVPNDHDARADTPRTRDDSFGYATYRELDGRWRRHSRARAIRRERDKVEELVAERIQTHGIYPDDVPPPIVYPETTPSPIYPGAAHSERPKTSDPSTEPTYVTPSSTGEAAAVADFRPAFVPGPEHPGVGWRVSRRTEPYSFEIPFEDGSRGQAPYIRFVINQKEQPVALGTEGKDKPQYYKPLCALPMPARTDAGVPAGHSLALFSVEHTARNEVDRALALVADPGAAADVHRFRMSMKRKQELFARMRDLDIAWNDWLAGAEDIDRRLRTSNISSHTKPISTIWKVWHRSPFLPDPANYPSHSVEIPLYHARSCMEKSNKALSASTATRTIPLDSAPDPTFYANTPRVAVFPFITQGSGCLAQSESSIHLDPNHMTVLTQSA